MPWHVFVLTCLLRLISGCDALVLRRQEALLAPRRHAANHRGMLQGTHSSEMLHTQVTHMKSSKRLLCWQKKKTVQRRHGGRRFGTQTFYTKLACVEGMQIDAACVLNVYTAVTFRVSWRPPGLSEGPGGLGTSFVKEPRGSCRGRLEHTWQFKPLGRFAGITPNWLWRLAVSPRPKMVCRCALCIGREFGSHGGRKGFFRNHWCGW